MSYSLSTETNFHPVETVMTIFFVCIWALLIPPGFHFKFLCFAKSRSFLEAAGLFALCNVSVLVLM